MTLSTCTYEFGDARFVVVARKVRNGESLSVDTDKATLNPNPLMPDVWYRLYGGSKPTGNTVSGIVKPSSSSSAPSSSSSAPSSSSSAPSSSSSQPSSSSSAPPSSSSQPSSSSSAPPSSSSAPPSSSSDPYEEDEPPIGGGNIDDPYEEDEPSTPSRPSDVAEEILRVKVNGSTKQMEARELIGQMVQNETGGQFHIEALKAHVVSSYTYVKYYNDVLGSVPTVALSSNVNQSVWKAVDSVLGEAIYYNGQYINAVYHSASCGETASAKSVWGSSVPYLVPVDSWVDEYSPYYKGSYTISEEDLADRVWSTYRIDLYEEMPNDPEDWIVIDYDNMASGDYVGRVEVGGYDCSQGGKVSSGTSITGRSIREQLLNFSLKSTCFEVSYRNGKFTFTTRGYGHGVGMSQWGAHYLAQDEGYSYIEILEHYYTDTTVK